MFILILITFVGASEPPTIARSDLCPNGWVEMVSFDMGRLIFNIIFSISFISICCCIIIIHLLFKGCILINETLYGSAVSWEEAHKVCYNNNARLLEIYTEMQKNILALLIGININI